MRGTTKLATERVNEKMSLEQSAMSVRMLTPWAKEWTYEPVKPMGNSHSRTELGTVKGRRLRN